MAYGSSRTFPVAKEGCIVILVPTSGVRQNTIMTGPGSGTPDADRHDVSMQKLHFVFMVRALTDSPYSRALAGLALGLEITRQP